MNPASLAGGGGGGGGIYYGLSARRHGGALEATEKREARVAQEAEDMYQVSWPLFLS
jgi:hypothetical protein